MIEDGRNHILASLDAFLGEWSVEATVPVLGPTPIEGRSKFEWTLDGQFLMQRSETSHRDAPDSLAIVSLDSDRDVLIQHYFDARGVVRLYTMGFHNNVWTLIRDAPDFSPLAFSQRFTATFSEDGSTIDGAWEMAGDGSSWQHDLQMKFTKVR
jgi:hypothetical protein